MHYLQSENVVLLVIFQTYGVSSHHDGHSYVCSMGLWFLLHSVCCNYCKRSDRQHSLLCSLCSTSVLQWPQKMTSQHQQGYHFTALTSFSATGSTFTISVVIIRVWFESCLYLEIRKAFGASENHEWFALVNIPQLSLGIFIY